MVIKKKKVKNEKKENLLPRPPVVVVIGHVDHGKTTLLDQIKKTNIAGREMGGITQKIGAYEVEVEKGKAKEKITFLDTPGHEAFSGMRQRGIKVADVAILVVAADDGVQPQTIEAIKFAQSAKIPILVAFNKTDRPDADVARTKKQLSEHGIQTEDWGGQTLGVEISAKTGKGIKDLLDAVLLLSEMEDLRADSGAPASGIVLESKIDSRKGISATFLVKNGILKIRDIVVAEGILGKIKRMEDFKGKAIKFATAGTAAVVMGMESLPGPGETFAVYGSVAEAARVAGARPEKEKTFFLPTSRTTGLLQSPALMRGEASGPGAAGEEKPARYLRLVLKADSAGTLEALETVLGNIKIAGMNLEIIKKGVGGISENDVKDAAVTQAAILGFNSAASPALEEFAKQKKVKIITEKVVYKLIENVKELAVSILPPKVVKTITGKLHVIAVFKTKKSVGENFEQVFGAKVIDGGIPRGAGIEIFRKGVSLGKGKVVELQFNKQAVEEVLKPNNAGIHYKGNAKIELGDALEAYTEEIIKQKI